jgi:hypothetical protein
MSRFDRRLKGAGLKPGESTCNIKQQSNYAGMNWGRQNNLGNQNLQQPQQQNMSYNPNLQQMQQNNVDFSTQNNVDNFSPNPNVLSIEEKNARLEEVEKTAPSAEMRLLTRHEIRLNNLEASTLTNRDLGVLSNNNLEKGAFDNKLKLLESNFFTKITQMENTCQEMIKSSTSIFQKRLNDYEMKFNTMSITNDALKTELSKLNERANSEKIRLVVKDKKIVIPDNSDEDEEDIKKVVSDAISKIK